MDTKQRPVTALQPERQVARTVDLAGLYREWSDHVERWARALSGFNADSNDIAQEVFLVVGRRIHDFDGVNPRAWLYRITERAARDYRNRTWFKHLFTRRTTFVPEHLQS